MAVEDVASVKAALLAAGQNLDGACGAFKITSTVAWNLRADGWGLIASTGNGCASGPLGNCRADTIMKQDGTVIDILIKSESNNGQVFPAVSQDSYNIPAWMSSGSQPPANWRAPYDPGLISGVNPPQPPDSGNGGVGPIDDKTDLIIAQIHDLRAIVDQMWTMVQNQDALIVQTRDQTCNKGYYNNLIRDIRPK